MMSEIMDSGVSIIIEGDAAPDDAHPRFISRDSGVQ